MSDYENIEKNAIKRCESRDRKKRQRMKVTGKSVFLIQKLKLQKPENDKKNR